VGSHQGRWLKLNCAGRHEEAAGLQMPIHSMQILIEEIAVGKNHCSPAVQLKGVIKQFGNVVAVQKLDLVFEEGSLVTLLGPSGCGKTTILRMIAGLETPTEGDIYIKGKRVNDVPIHKRNLGMIFQNYALFPHKTIFDNVAFGLKYRDVAKNEVEGKVKKALEMVRLPGVEKRMPSQLSGGQQQRIAMARAIVIEPDVLLMDEPLSALDENLREEMRREIDNLQQILGVTTVFVTHDQREALSMSDKIVVMNEGLKQQEGSPEEVYNLPNNHFVADFLGHSNFFKGVVADQEGDMISLELRDGNLFRVKHPGQWKPGDPVEMVVRAQSFKVTSVDEQPPEQGMNTFDGMIKDRSYMGGEVSYFVQLESGTMVHAIGLAKLRPIRKNTSVRVHVAPRHCGLLRVAE
jgi:putative spermidine/putrescine transport system ATP-binding protein/spermidine/putrescine transport system ATP-binding protein